MGDSNVKAYEVAMKYMLMAKAELEGVSSEDDGHSLMQQISRQSAEQGISPAPLAATNSANNLLPPKKVTKQGRPSASRDKPPYEQNKKRRKRHAIYYEKEHTSCPVQLTQRNGVTCSRCLLKGHNRSHCNRPAPDEFPAFEFPVQPEANSTRMPHNEFPPFEFAGQPFQLPVQSDITVPNQYNLLACFE